MTAGEIKMNLLAFTEINLDYLVGPNVITKALESGRGRLLDYEKRSVREIQHCWL